MGIKKRSEGPAKDVPGDCVCPLTGFWKKLPNLNEFLREGVYEDGSKRARPTLLVFIEDGLWKGRLLDRDNDEAAWLSANGLSELLERFESGLGMEGMEWRKALPPRKGKN